MPQESGADRSVTRELVYMHGIGQNCHEVVQGCSTLKHNVVIWRIKQPTLVFWETSFIPSLD